jgi:hypothetical protein
MIIISSNNNKFISNKIFIVISSKNMMHQQ